MKPSLVKQVAGALDVPAAGLGLGLVGLVVAVAVLGAAPIGLAVGLLALLVID